MTRYRSYRKQPTVTDLVYQAFMRLGVRLVAVWHRRKWKGGLLYAAPQWGSDVLYRFRSARDLKKFTQRYINEQARRAA